MFWLKYRGSRVDVADGEVIAGRGFRCAIVLDTPVASRQHCKVFERTGRLFAQDLGSTNGTFVNGVRLTGERELSGGDVVSVGAEMIEVVAGPEPGSFRPHQPVRTERPDSGVGADSREETVRHVGLELVDTLLAHARSSGRPQAMATAIRAALDNFVRQARTEGRVVSDGEIARVSAVSEEIVRWDASFVPWREELLGKLRR